MPDAPFRLRADAAVMSSYSTQQSADPAETAARRLGIGLALAVATAVAMGPQVLTVSRAVANVPVSAAAVAWGRSHDGDCDLHRDLTVSCASMHAP